MDFEVTCTGPDRTRRGRLLFGDREIQTPAFMPCASVAVLRACPSHLVFDQGIQMMIANAYHLWQRPGMDLIQQAGGLHAFMSWPGALATDSGGYQAFSLADPSDITEEGVAFQSHIDGSPLHLSPEKSIQIQNALDADIAMVLDECVALPAERKYIEESVELTARWAERCKEAHSNPQQALFGIVQGATWPDLREKSARYTVDIGFDGYAIGGLSVGESRSEMLAAIDACIRHLPSESPRYLMGVGTPLDIVETAMRGVDLFDCVLPTRMARHGSLVTWEGPLKISRAEYREDLRPISESCDCPACRNYSRAYLHHLLRIEDAAGWQLLSLHNLRYYAQMMEALRSAIKEGTVDSLRDRLDPWTERDRAADGDGA